VDEKKHPGHGEANKRAQSSEIVFLDNWREEKEREPLRARGANVAPASKTLETDEREKSRGRAVRGKGSASIEITREGISKHAENRPTGDVT